MKCKFSDNSWHHNLKSGCTLTSRWFSHRNKNIHKKRVYTTSLNCTPYNYLKPSAKKLIIEKKRKSLVKTTEEFKKYICIKNCSRLGYMATMHMVADSLLT